MWTADRIVIPWEINTPYPYSTDRHFIVPPDKPFLEPLSCLAFLAGATESILLGMSVLVLPYRHPIYWAKVATTIDHLSRGRLILGIGVGWMAEEFETLGVSFRDRGAITDEQMKMVKQLWETNRSRFHGDFYHFEKEIAFYPKPFQGHSLPIWVGGEGIRAQRRAGLYGDAWFPYFVKMTPHELKLRFDNVLRSAIDSGRDGDQIHLSCCLPIELTNNPVQQEEGRLKGAPAQIIEALKGFQEVGVEHIALQFMVPHWPERQEQIEQFAKEVIPSLRQLK